MRYIISVIFGKKYQLPFCLSSFASGIAIHFIMIYKFEPRQQRVPRISRHIRYLTSYRGDNTSCP